MVRLSVMYPSGDGAKFDFDYYVTCHVPMARRLMQGAGLVDAQVDRAVDGLAGAPAPFACVGHFVFTSLDRLQAALQAHGQALAEDVPNFTNVSPQFTISDVVDRFES